MTFGVILAAGSSKRLKKKEKKQFINIGGKPVFYYSVDKFLAIKKINHIILVISKVDRDSKIIKSFINEYNNYIVNGRINIIIGGKERYDSVYNSLKFIEENYFVSKNDSIIIHDSARPLVAHTDIIKLIDKVKKYKAISLSTAVYDTIKEVSKNLSGVNKVIKTYNRNNFNLVSTPQAFNFLLLSNAYTKFYSNKKSKRITDDLQIIENYSNYKPFLIESTNVNFKITIQSDLNMLEYFMGLSRSRQRK